MLLFLVLTVNSTQCLELYGVTHFTLAACSFALLPQYSTVQYSLSCTHKHIKSDRWPCYEWAWRRRRGKLLCPLTSEINCSLPFLKAVIIGGVSNASFTCSRGRNTCQIREESTLRPINPLKATLLVYYNIGECEQRLLQHLPWLPLHECA